MGRKKKRLENGVLTWFDTLLEEYQRVGRLTKVSAVKVARNRFADFLTWMGKEDIALDVLDARLMAMYETWLQSQKVSRNSSSNYLRTMKTCFNVAKERGMAVGSTPGEDIFKEVYTGIALKTERATVGKDIVQRLRDLDIDKVYAEKGKKRQITYFNNMILSLKQARDIFIFSVCAQGMDFVDVCFLRKKDVHDGTIHYVRHKSKKEVEVKVLPQMQEIMERHKGAEDSPWLFNLLTATDSQKTFTQHRNKLTLYMRYLKTLSELMGLEEPLRPSSARDAWATATFGAHVSPSVVAKAMGFSTEAAAKKYLATLKGEEVSKANESVVNSIFE